MAARAAAASDDIDAAFDGALGLEEHFLAAGYAEGTVRGAACGLDDGTVVGNHRGRELGRELGRFRGRIDMLNALVAAGSAPRHLPERRAHQRSSLPFPRGVAPPRRAGSPQDISAAERGGRHHPDGAAGATG